MAIPTYVPPIISLIALIAPVINLLRVIFETAEGYRKCSEAVIGPWSKLRWRRWSWSEFRFEVHFVTPKLELQDISETRLNDASYRAHFFTLRDRVPNKQQDKVDYKRPAFVVHEILEWYRGLFNSAKRANALFLSGDVLDTSLTSEFDSRIVKSENSTVLLNHANREQVDVPLVNHRFISDQRVSWLSFLRHLYRVQNRTVSASSSRPPSNLGSYL